MKKLMCVLISLVLLATSSMSMVYAKKGSEQKVRGSYKKEVKVEKGRGSNKEKKVEKKRSNLEYDGFKMLVDGQEIDCSNFKVIKLGWMVVPVEPVTDGLKADLKWNEKKHIVAISKDSNNIVIYLDKKIITVNGKPVDSKILLSDKKDRVIKTVVYIAQLLGYDARYDSDTNTIIANTEKYITINDNTTGTGNNQFEYAGNWSYSVHEAAYMNDIHSSSVTGAYMQFRFNGEKVKLYGSKADNQGIVLISIDDNYKTNIDLYSAKRQDNVLIYSNSKLKAGDHVLKVYVAGMKNKRSKECNVTIDRVDIKTSTTSTSAPVNIALSKQASSDSELNGYPASKANDGNLQTSWYALDGNANHWWKVDLGGAYNLTGAELNMPAADKVYGYKIEVSGDNVNWVCAVDKSNNTNKQQVQTDVFKANQIRYVRVTITGVEPGSVAGILEVKIFGALPTV